MHRPSKVVLTQDEVDAFSCISFILDTEADNVEDYVPDAPASDVSRNAGEGTDNPTIAEALRAVAKWLRTIINRAMR